MLMPGAGPPQAAAHSKIRPCSCLNRLFLASAKLHDVGITSTNSKSADSRSESSKQQTLGRLTGWHFGEARVQSNEKTMPAASLAGRNKSFIYVSAPRVFVYKASAVKPAGDVSKQVRIRFPFLLLERETPAFAF